MKEEITTEDKEFSSQRKNGLLKVKEWAPKKLYIKVF